MAALRRRSNCWRGARIGGGGEVTPGRLIVSKVRQLPRPAVLAGLSRPLAISGAARRGGRKAHSSPGSVWLRACSQRRDGREDSRYEK